MSAERSSTFDEYLAAVVQPSARETLQALRSIVKSELPEAEELIHYRMPAFKVKKVIVWIAAFQNHCSLFAGTTIKAYGDELSAYVTTAGSIHFPHGEPLPEAIIRKVVRARLNEVLLGV